MRAVRIDEPGALAVVDIEPPTPGIDEVVVDVAYAGICGSDVELFAGRRPGDFARYPIVPGHEWSGTVHSVGEGVDPDLIGRNVVAEGFRSCGRCALCHSGEAVLCESGYDEIGFTRPGAWADQLVVGADQVHVLDDAADLRSAAGLEPAACAADAVERAALRGGERVAVVGGGTIGLLAVQLVLARTPAHLLVIEPNRRRRELATAWAARGVHPEDLAAIDGDFDVVIEAAGTQEAARTAVGLARRGGCVVLAGIPGPTATLAVRHLVTKRLRIATVFGATRSAWDLAVSAFDEGVLDPGGLVTHDLDLGDAAEALRLLSTPADDLGKVLLRP